MKKKFIEFFWEWLARIALWFRYKTTVKGFENLNSQTLTKPGGVLFLPNHPTYFVDSAAAVLSLLPKFLVRPMIIEYMYYYPIVNTVMREMNALPVPSFEHSSNTLKRKKSEKVIREVIQGLKKGEHFLIYPTGRAKMTAHESIGGTSSVHKILQETPEANVVLIRIKGLWGSKFSWALTGTKPQMFGTIWWGIKQVFKNLLFFTPRREIIVELVPVPADFPFNASRLELNQWLEHWFNQPDGLSRQSGDHPGDSLVLVPHSIWSKKLPEVHVEECLPNKPSIDTAKIPVSIQEKVISKLASMTGRVPSSIHPEMSLSNDLGMDSLDTAELAVYLHDQFDITSVPIKELTAVDRVMGIAAKQIMCEGPQLEEEVNDMSKWYGPIKKEKRTMPVGNTIPEVFIRQCKKSGKRTACGDAHSGILSYHDLLVRSIILARLIRKMPSKTIGIMLPSSVAANICILATQLAGKVPVMINWTLGPRHLESVLKLSEPQVILSSWSFIDRLEGVDLSPIEDQLILLEDMRRDIGLSNKIHGWLTSKLSVSSILRSLNPDGLNANDTAAILFTSGTESLPKAVPLTHNNFLSNQRAALDDILIYSDDVLLGILPPFHSFGFSISSLMPILAGVKVAFYSDPRDGRALADNFECWKATLLCGTPTFIKGLLISAQPFQLKTMRMCVTGAEKAPPELFEMFREIGKEECLVEGYGVTECAPVLTMGRLELPKKGVGQPLHNVELIVVHPDTHHPLPLNKQGLILARGPNIFAGYLNPGIEPPFVEVKGKSWYCTGDLGEIDELGNVTISGRLKRFIKVGSEMISLSATEDGLLQMAPQKGWPINQYGPTFAICAKEIPGEKPKIYLFTKFFVGLEEVNKSLKEAGFSNLVRISAVQQIDDIPVMGSGKVNYRLLEQRYLGGK